MAAGAVFNYSIIGEFQLGYSRSDGSKTDLQAIKTAIAKATGNQFEPWSAMRFTPESSLLRAWLGELARHTIPRGPNAGFRAISAFGVQWQDFSSTIERDTLEPVEGRAGRLRKTNEFMQQKILIDFLWLLLLIVILYCASVESGEQWGYCQNAVLWGASFFAVLLGYECWRLGATKKDYPYFAGVWIFLECSKFSHGLYLRMTDMFAKMGARNYADCLFVRMRRRELVDRDFSGGFARLVYGNLTRYGTNTRLFTILFFGMFGLCMLSVDANKLDIYKPSVVNLRPWAVFTNIAGNCFRQLVEPPGTAPSFWTDSREQAEAGFNDMPLTPKMAKGSITILDVTQRSDAQVKPIGPNLPAVKKISTPTLGTSLQPKQSDKPSKPDTGFQFLSRYPLLLTGGNVTIGTGFLILRSLWWLWWALVIAEVFGLLRKFSTEGMQR